MRNIDPRQRSSRSSDLMLAATVVITSFGVLAATYKLTVAYSYWLDELFSVNFSLQSWTALHRTTLADVHPPLYQLVLKFWISSFGTSEPAVRSFSWLCAMSALIIMYRDASALDRVTRGVATSLFATNWLFCVYANEARAYALAMLFATTASATFIHTETWRRRALFLASCLFLSLTHYFGLLLSVLLIAFKMTEKWRDRNFRTSLSCTIGLMSVWPLHHMVHGEILQRTGGNFWIEVNGVSDSLSIAAKGLLGIPGSASAFALLGSIAVLTLVASVQLRRRSSSEHAAWRKQKSIGSVLLIFLTLTALADIHSPMSTERNYIVLLPLVSLFWGITVSLACRALPRIAAASLAASIFCACLSLSISLAAIRAKASHPQDWKNAIRIAVENSSERAIYFDTFDHVVDAYISTYGGPQAVARRYLKGSTVLVRPAVLISRVPTGGQNPRESPLEPAALGGRRIFPTGKEPQAGAVTVYLLD